MHLIVLLIDFVVRLDLERCALTKRLFVLSSAIATLALSGSLTTNDQVNNRTTLSSLDTNERVPEHSHLTTSPFARLVLIVIKALSSK
jgi:hypothetical protein